MITRILLLLALVTACSAQPYVYVNYRLSDNVIMVLSSGWPDTDVSVMGEPSAGTTWTAVLASDCLATGSTSNPASTVPLYYLDTGTVTDRSPTTVSNEQAAEERKDARARLYSLRNNLTQLQNLITANPADTELLDEQASLITQIATTNVSVDLPVPTNSLASWTGNVSETQSQKIYSDMPLPAPFQSLTDVGWQFLDSFGNPILDIGVGTTRNVSTSGYLRSLDLSADTGSPYCTKHGYGALALNVGSQNNACGYGALGANTSGYYNTALGTNPLASNVSGYQNVAIGVNALYSNISNSDCIGIGFSAFAFSDAPENIGIGTNAGLGTTSGNHNLALGGYSLVSNITGSNNVALGTQAMQGGTAISNCVSIGEDSMFNANGSGLVAVGMQALHELTSGQYATVVGFRAAYDSTTPDRVTAFGYEALRYNVTGGDNLAFGYNAGSFAFTGTYNTTSNECIFIGHDTVAQTNTDTNEVVIGNDAIGAGSNSVTLGNTLTTTTVLQGTISNRGMNPSLCLFESTADTTVTATGSQTLDAGTSAYRTDELNATGRHLRVTMAGIATTGVSPGTDTVSFAVGSTAFDSASLTLPSLATDAPWKASFDIVVRTTGATGDARWSGDACFSTAAGVQTRLSSGGIKTGVDWTGTPTLAALTNFSASGNSITIQQFTIEEVH